MKLLGIDFGPVTDASGVRGFFGEGYPYHRPLKPFGLNFAGSCFVSKTGTAYRRQGWLLYKEDDITPLERFPQCVIIKWRQAVVLNAVGLGNPGLAALLQRGEWQQRQAPFLISLMAVGDTPQKRLDEMEMMTHLLAKHRRTFKAPFGIQLNLSCSNTALNVCLLAHEASDLLCVAAYNLPDVPLMPKFSAEVSPPDVLSVTEDKNCHAISISNAVHWGSLRDRINWKEIFGQDLSPLHVYGGGALSGVPLRPIVLDWVMKARAIGIRVPINAGSIFRIVDAQALFEAEADSVALGTVAMLRPWRVSKIIKAVHSWF